MPNDDLISRSELIRRIDKCVEANYVDSDPLMTIRDIKALISVLSAVDAAPVVHAHWVDENPSDYMDARMRCSACGRIDTPFADWDYCPHCGAKMREDE